MNRGLLWSLGGTAAVSAWVLLNPAPSTDASSVNLVAAAPAHVPAESAKAVMPSAETASTLAPIGNGASAAGASAVLPRHWPQPNIEPAVRNPFLVTPPPPPAPKPVAAPVAAPLPAPPPVSNYRFWGRLAVAGGQKLTYVARGHAGSPAAIDVGTRLEDGWSVEAIGDNTIVLVHAVTQQRSTLSIPPHSPAGQP